MIVFDEQHLVGCCECDWLEGAPSWDAGALLYDGHECSEHRS